jgi:hypothetical protein
MPPVQKGCAPKSEGNEEITMPMKGRTECAVRECGAPISGYGNLCDAHIIPGAIVRMGKSTMIITSWHVEHEHECGIVFLNDFALGDLFSGRTGFEAKLRDQGFVNVRLLRTPEELETARSTTLASWSGSWQAQYPWHAPKKERVFSDLRAIVLTDIAGEEGDTLMALVYRDDVKLKYPDGSARTVTINERLETAASVDDLIDLTETSLRAYCSTITTETPQLTVHRAPAGLDDEGTRKWLENLPGVELVEHCEQGEGFGGLVPPGQKE